jgi:hypothetical protein
MTRANRLGYMIAVAAVIAIALYNAFWFVLDIGVRLNLITGIVFGIDAPNFTAALTVWNEVFFFTSAIASFIAVPCILMHSRWALWAFGTCFAAGVSDWFMLIVNPYYDGSGAGLATTVATIATLALLLLLRWRRILN